MTHARIEDNVVVEISLADPSTRFHPDLAARFVPVPDTVVVGSRFQNGTWLAPVIGQPTPPPRVPYELPIIDLLRRFTAAELTAYVPLETEARGLTAADIALAANGDIHMQMLVPFRIFLLFLDALDGVIQLNHPETIQFFWLLVALGVLTPQRVNQVLSVETPA